MGRNSLIPAAFADQYIKFRVPYSMPGEQLVEAGQRGVFFPEAVFNVNIDKPFEIERMIVRLTALDDENVVLPVQPTILQKLIRLTLKDTSKNEDITKAAHLVETLISSEQGDAGSWEWYVPYTMVRSEGFQVGIDSDAFPVGVEFVRVEIAFQGSLIVIKPASETR